MKTLPMKPALNSEGKQLYINSCGFIANITGQYCLFCSAGQHHGGDWQVLYVADTDLVNEWNALVAELPADLHKFKIEV